MGVLPMTTIAGSSTTLAASDIADFKAGLRGQLLCPSDSGYDDAHTIWNAHIDKRPAMIAPCIGVADVVELTDQYDPSNFFRNNQTIRP
ncbi:MAG: BBE domain-containing protein, partial [Candidatus Tectomicrobia bacterium]|nr:BBE domain-containing protein [Candidatus Tectomicrobia bacterium]